MLITPCNKSANWASITQTQLALTKSLSTEKKIKFNSPSRHRLCLIKKADWMCSIWIQLFLESQTVALFLFDLYLHVRQLRRLAHWKKCPWKTWIYWTKPHVFFFSKMWSGQHKESLILKASANTTLVKLLWWNTHTGLLPTQKEQFELASKEKILISLYETKCVM